MPAFEQARLNESADEVGAVVFSLLSFGEETFPGGALKVWRTLARMRRVWRARGAKRFMPLRRAWLAEAFEAEGDHCVDLEGFGGFGEGLICDWWKGLLGKFDFDARTRLINR